MRRSYRYDPVTDSMVEYTNSWSRKQEKSHYVQPDITPFVSPIDGSVIKSRSDLRVHMKHHDVVHPDDYKEHRVKKIKERELYNKGIHPSQIEGRKQALSEAFEKTRDRRIADGTWRK
jgi:hypothetical protein